MPSIVNAGHPTASCTPAKLALGPTQLAISQTTYRGLEDVVGLLDHRRRWTYEVSASPSECIKAFTSAFSGRGGLMAKARWNVQTTSNGASATYEGRKGLGAVGGILSQTAAQEADTARRRQIQRLGHE